MSAGRREQNYGHVTETEQKCVSSSNFYPHEHTSRPKLLGICIRPPVRGLRRTKMLSDGSIRYQVSIKESDTRRERKVSNYSFQVSGNVASLMSML